MLATSNQHSLKYGILIGLTQCSIIMTILSQTAIAFNVEYYGGIIKANPKTTLLSYNIWQAAKTQHENGSYGQFALMIIFAGIWPYLKNLILLAAFLLPQKWKSSPLVDYTIGSAQYHCGKWAYIDIWVVATIVAVVQIKFRSMVILIDVETSIGYGIYLYAVSAMLSQFVAGMHVWLLEDQVQFYKHNKALVKQQITANSFDPPLIYEDHKKHQYDASAVDKFGLHRVVEEKQNSSVIPEDREQSQSMHDHEHVRLSNISNSSIGSYSSSGYSLSSIQSTESAFLKYVAKETMKALRNQRPIKHIEIDQPAPQYYHYDWPVLEAVTHVGSYDALQNPDKAGCTCQSTHTKQHIQSIPVYSNIMHNPNQHIHDALASEESECFADDGAVSMYETVDDWTDLQVDPRLLPNLEQRRNSMVIYTSMNNTNMPTDQTWRGSMASSARLSVVSQPQSQPTSPNRPSITTPSIHSSSITYQSTSHSVSLIDTALQRVRVSTTGVELPLPDGLDAIRSSQAYSVWSQQEPALYFERARALFLALISQHKVGCPCYPLQQENIHQKHIDATAATLEDEEKNCNEDWYIAAADIAEQHDKTYNITIPSSTRNIDTVLDAHITSPFRRKTDTGCILSPSAILRQHDTNEVDTAQNVEWHTSLGVLCVNTSAAVQDILINIDSKVQRATVLSPRMQMDFSELVVRKQAMEDQSTGFQYPNSLLQDPLGLDWELEHAELCDEGQASQTAYQVSKELACKVTTGIISLFPCLKKNKKPQVPPPTPEELRHAQELVTSAEVSVESKIIHCDVQVGQDGQVRLLLSDANNNAHICTANTLPNLPTPQAESPVSRNLQLILDELDHDIQQLAIHPSMPLDSVSPTNHIPSINKENTLLIPIGLNLYNVHITEAVVEQMRKHQLQKAQNTLLLIKTKAFLMSVFAMLICACVVYSCSLTMFTLHIRFIERTIVFESYSLQQYVTVFMSDTTNRSYFLALISVICLIGLPLLSMCMLVLASFLRIILLSTCVTGGTPYLLKCIRQAHFIYRYTIPWMVLDVFALSAFVVIQEVPAVVERYGDNKLFFALQVSNGLYLVGFSSFLLFLLTYPINRWTRIPAVLDKSDFPKLHYKPRGYRGVMDIPNIN